MSIKNSQNSNMSNEKKKKIMQVGAVCLGALLLTGYASQMNREEERNTANQEEEWTVSWDDVLGYNKKEIRSYEKHNGKYEKNEKFVENSNADLELKSNSKVWYTWTEDKVSDSVIRGDYGNGQERKIALEEAGYDYDIIQSLVNLKCYNQDYTLINPNCIYDPVSMFSFENPKPGMETSILYLDEPSNIDKSDDYDPFSPAPEKNPAEMAERSTELESSR